MGEKKNLKKFIPIIIVIIVIIAVVLFKIYNDKNNKTNESLNETESEIDNVEDIEFEEISPNDIQKQLETLDTNSAIIQQLYGYVLKSDDFKGSFACTNGYEPTSFYRDEKVTYDSLSNIEKMLTVVKNYKSSEIRKTTKDKMKDISIASYMYEDIDVYKNIDKKTKAIFNQTNPNWMDYIGNGYGFIYRNDCYYLTKFKALSSGTNIRTYSKIQKIDKDQENVYIYDKFIYINTKNIMLGEGDFKIHVYTSCNETNDIGAETSEKVTAKELYEKYENQLKTYKHTFKQKEDGSYYWLSTEIYE